MVVIIIYFFDIEVKLTFMQSSLSGHIALCGSAA